MFSRWLHDHRTTSRTPWVTALALLALTASSALAQDLDPSEGVLDYLTRNADRVALVHYVATPEGTPDSRFPSIVHRDDLPLPLASTAKILLLATYAREVEAGRLDPGELISLADWQLHYHPLFEDHAPILATLGIATDAHGFVLNPGDTVPLDLIVTAMIRFSDSAATDYLLTRMGGAAFAGTVARAGLEGQDPMYSAAGFLMLLANHADGLVTPERLDHLLTTDRPAIMAEAERLATLYREDPVWRQEEILWQQETQPLPPPGVLAALTDAHNPRGIARDFARVLAEVVTDRFLSPTVSSLMRGHLELPLAGTGLDDIFFAIGSKGGDSEGTLTLARYSRPKVGELAGLPVVTVLFVNGIEPAIDVLEALGEPVEIFFLRLWLEGPFVARVAATLCTPDASTACLQQGRFRVRLDWDGIEAQGGAGRVSPQSTQDSALFYFYRPENLELLVKVLDGCGYNGRFWVFSAAATDVGYSFTVTDTASGVTQTYRNSLGQPAPAVTDTNAFATCDGEP